MQYLIRRIRGLRLSGPTYARHYFLNGIGFTCKVADRIFRTNLADRWKTARMGAMVNDALHKAPFTARSVWQQFKNPAS